MIFKNDELIKETNFPSEKDPGKKGLEYCIKYAHAIYSLHLNNKAGISYSSQAEDYYRLRLYGAGDQPEEIYKKYWLGETTTDNTSREHYTDVDGKGGWSQQTPSGKRKGYMNVLWKVISTAPKIKAALIGKFQRAEWDIVASAIDPYSGAEKESKKYDAWYIKQNHDFLAEFHKIAGVPMEEMEYAPESLDELDLIEERGGFKLEYEKEMEKVVSHTFNISRFKEIKDMMMADAIDLGVFGCREHFDEECNKFKIKYVDPEYMVIQYSKYNDFRDSEFAGHIEQMTIGELRQNFQREGVTFNEKELSKVAKEYCAHFNNPGVDEWEKYSKEIEKSGSYGYDFFKVNIFHCEWFDIDGEQSLVHTNRHGGKKVINQKYGTKNKDNDRNKTVLTQERYKYQCSWLIGSESMAFNYGKAYDILRPTDKTLALSYHFFKLPTKSLTDQLIPMYDNFMNLWVKYQNALAMAMNKGAFINITSLGNVSSTDAAKGAQEPEAVKRLFQTGFGFFKETNAMTTRNSTMKPFYEIEGGMGSIFDEIYRGFQMNIEMVEQLTGVSPLALGTVDPKAPVGTSELSYQNTQDTLRPILNGYSTIKERAASNTICWVQMKLSDKEVVDAYKPVIGESGIQILKIAEGNHVKYGIKLEAQPTEIERNEIYEAAKISLASRRDGGSGISFADFAIILQIIFSGGSLKLAEIVLNDRIRRHEKERDKVAKENMAMQQEYAMATEQMKQQSSFALEKVKTDEQIRLEYAKAVFDVMVKTPDSQMKQKEMLELQTFYDAVLKKMDQDAQMQGAMPSA